MPKVVRLRKLQFQRDGKVRHTVFERNGQVLLVASQSHVVAVVLHNEHVATNVVFEQGKPNRLALAKQAHKLVLGKHGNLVVHKVDLRFALVVATLVVGGNCFHVVQKTRLQ